MEWSPTGQQCAHPQLARCQAVNLGRVERPAIDHPANRLAGDGLQQFGKVGPAVGVEGEVAIIMRCEPLTRPHGDAPVASGGQPFRQLISSPTPLGKQEPADRRGCLGHGVRFLPHPVEPIDEVGGGFIWLTAGDTVADKSPDGQAEAAVGTADVEVGNDPVVAAIGDLHMDRCSGTGRREEMHRPDLPR